MSATNGSESTRRASELLTAAFLRAYKKPFTGDPVEWLEEHFRIPFSARSQRFKRDNAPHLSEIIRCAVDLKYQKLVVRGCTGGGKTTLLEATAVFNVAVEHGPMLVVGQTNEDVKAWVESRYNPIIDACPVLHQHLSQNRHKRRNDAILWDHMAQYFTGANISGLQEKSIRFCYGDETWLWERGRVGEMKARHHNRWNRKTILVSQGWETSSDEPHDMDAEYVEGDDRRREFQCPECGQWQLYAWEQIKYSPVLGSTFSVDYEKTGSTARLECRFCKHEIADTSAERRSLSENARWTPYNAENAARNDDGSIKVASFWLPAWAVWWIPWKEIVIEWLKAQYAKGIGDLEPFRLWTMKVAANPWVLDTTRITDSDVRAMVNADYAQRTCPIEPALVTMCADVAERLTHYSVCAWSWDGEGYIIDYGTTLAPINLLEIAQKSEYPIFLNKQPTAMIAKVNVGLIDSGDFTEEIYTVCRSQSTDIFSPSKGSGAQFGRNVWHAQELKEYGGIILYTYVDYHAKQELYINKIAKKTAPRLYFPADSSDEFLHGFTGQKIVISEKGRREFKEIPWDHYGDTVKLHLVCWWVKRPRE